MGNIRVLRAGHDDRRTDILPQALLRGEEGHLIKIRAGFVFLFGEFMQFVFRECVLNHYLC